MSVTNREERYGCPCPVCGAPIIMFEGWSKRDEVKARWWRCRVGGTVHFSYWRLRHITVIRELIKAERQRLYEQMPHLRDGLLTISRYVAEGREIPSP